MSRRLRLEDRVLRWLFRNCNQAADNPRNAVTTLSAAARNVTLRL